jgi:hypothetical protein
VSRIDRQQSLTIRERLIGAPMCSLGQMVAARVSSLSGDSGGDPGKGASAVGFEGELASEGVEDGLDPLPGYISAELDAYLRTRSANLLPPPTAAARPARPGTACPLRQLIESVYDTLNGRLDLNPTVDAAVRAGTARVVQRILALTSAIGHNRTAAQPFARSLIAYDH